MRQHPPATLLSPPVQAMRVSLGLIVVFLVGVQMQMGE
jgi:hypothetical protein